MATKLTLPPVLPKGYLREQFENLAKHGLPQGLDTGIKSLDNICRLDKGRLITVTGVPNLGKSEFIDFLTTTYNKRHGLKTLYFSPENAPVELHLEKIVRKYTCKPLRELTPEEREAAISYVLDNFYFLNCMEITQLPVIIKEAERMVVENHIDILVIDPYNRIDVEKNAADLETLYISKILDDLSRLAIRRNIMLFLVAHPKKMTVRDNGEFDIPSAYDINGSANFFNKSDYVLIVHRKKRLESRTTIKVDKVKFSNYGRPGVCELEYDLVSGNYYGLVSPDYGLDDINLPGWDVDVTSIDDDTPVPFLFPVQPKRDYLNTPISVFTNVADKEEGQVMTAREFLFTDKYKSIAQVIREGETPEERHNLKQKNKAQIPCATLSGVFTKTGGKNLVSRSGLLCIDIDWKDNKGVMEKVPGLLRQLPYVTFAAKSITGDGYFAIVPLENPNHHKEHYLAIEKEFRDKYGIVLDKQCKDVTRLRFATYDEAPYYNPLASTYYQELVETPKTAQPFVTTQSAPFKLEYSSTPSVADLDAKIREAMERGVNVVDAYQDWFPMCMSLASLGEEGRERFHAVSSTSPKYDRDECDAFFTDILARYPNEGNQYTLKTAFKILNTALHQ